MQHDDDEEDDTFGFDESINEYKDWLRERPTAAQEESNDSSESPPSEWPSHARKKKKQTEES
ncbi:hypothetical protein EJB05_54405, partial [Eragrostis curvula]